MTDYERQKVMSGMNACTDSRDCEECPYDAKYDRQTDCMYALINDMVKMIDELKQQQEPRVMTLEEAQSAFVVEYRSGKMLEVGSKLLDLDVDPLYAEHGKLYRFWTSRPTDEQREAVEWE